VSTGRRPQGHEASPRSANRKRGIRQQIIRSITAGFMSERASRECYTAPDSPPLYNDPEIEPDDAKCRAMGGWRKLPFDTRFGDLKMREINR
jgi:hypothetical protein